MKTYGLTLQDCEDLIRAVRRVPALWNEEFGWYKHSECQCVMGAAWKAGIDFVANPIGMHTYLGCELKMHPRIGQFAMDWFYPMVSYKGYGSWRAGGSTGLRWLTLLKLKAIREVLLDEAESREELCRWAPAVKEQGTIRPIRPLIYETEKS